MGRIVGVLVLAWLAGCQQGAKPFTDADRAAVADSLAAFARQMVADIDQHHVDKFIGYHEPVPGFAWSTSGSFVALDSMHATMRTYFADRRNTDVHFSLGEIKSHAMSRDAGVVSAIINSTSRDSTGAERRSHQGWTIAVERRNGAWRVVQAHESYPNERAPQ